jgi:hypothetical protein
MLHPEKTRLIEFGRYAASNRRRRGLCRPETFTFLGFTFICGISRRGYFQIHRKSRRDRITAKLKEIKEEVWRRLPPIGPGTGALAEAGRHRLLRLPRGADQHRGTQSLPVPCRQPVETCAPAPQSKGRDDQSREGERRRSCPVMNLACCTVPPSQSSGSPTSQCNDPQSVTGMGQTVRTTTTTSQSHKQRMRANHNIICLCSYSRRIKWLSIWQDEHRNCRGEACLAKM